MVGGTRCYSRGEKRKLISWPVWSLSGVEREVLDGRVAMPLGAADFTAHRIAERLAVGDRSCGLEHEDDDGDPRGRGLPGWEIGPQPRRGQAAPYRRHRVVDQTILEHRTAEGPADERSHHRLSQ
jgi:hypothetical protein